MPKKRTYEQLERALKKAQNEASREDESWQKWAKGFRRASEAELDKAADRVAEVEAKNDNLEHKLKTEGERILTLGQENCRISTLRQEEGTLADKHRAEAAELNLIHLRKALEASNRVSLGLMDIVQLPRIELPRKSDGITIGDIELPPEETH